MNPTDRLRSLLSQGHSRDEALGELRWAGTSPIGCIKAIHEAESVGLAEAKRRFRESASWANVHRSHDQFAEELETLIGELIETVTIYVALRDEGVPVWRPVAVARLSSEAGEPPLQPTSGAWHRVDSLQSAPLAAEWQCVGGPREKSANMIRTTAVVLWTLLAVLGCSTQDRVIMVDDKDPEMIAAIAEARAHVSEFVAALKAPQPGDRSFAIKTTIGDGKQLEHVWIDDVGYDGVAFTGKLGNDPELVDGHKLGESVRALPGEISDWMYVRQDRLVGGYSIRLLRRRMTASERARFDEGLDFKVE